MSFQTSKISKSVKVALAVGVFSLSTHVSAMTNEQADLNDDNVVNFLDMYEVIKLFGVRRGEVRYREGIDLDGDGVIGATDYMSLFANFGQSASTDETTFSGQVVDGDGIGIPGVRVQLGINTVEACTDQFGNYTMEVTAADFGDTELEFDGNGGTLGDGTLCVLQDPTPSTPSGEFPTIPHKPVFINGGTNNVFRQVSLPERDLTASIDVTTVASTDNGNNNFTLQEDVVVNNAGAEISVGNGCTIQFPAGETPRFSISRVDPAMLPVAPPPNLSSSLFVTFQPGGTQVDDCPDGVMVVFDNVDEYVNADDLNGPDQPFLSGVIDGAFQQLANVVVGDVDGSGVFTPSASGAAGTKLKATVPTPFDFAWYQVTVPLTPCPLTTVIGRVLLNNVAMDPVENAFVTLPGVGPVFTNELGVFGIPNVPAGPNGNRCVTNPFNLSVAASKDIDDSGTLTFNEFGASASTPALPGGITDLGDIKLGITGYGQG